MTPSRAEPMSEPWIEAAKDLIRAVRTDLCHMEPPAEDQLLRVRAFQSLADLENVISRHRPAPAGEALRDAGEDFVSSFESDFVIDGQVVDDPGWTPLVRLWQKMHAALRAAPGGEAKACGK